MEFIMICGLPNAGKTTYATNNFTDTISLDKIEFNVPAERMPKAKVMVMDRLLKIGSCSIEGAFATPSVRAKFIADLPKECKKTCIYINTSEEICLERSESGRSSDIVKRLAHTFKIPTVEEGWDEVLFIDNNTDNEGVIINGESEDNP